MYRPCGCRVDESEGVVAVVRAVTWRVRCHSRTPLPACRREEQQQDNTEAQLLLLHFINSCGVLEQESSSSNSARIVHRVPSSARCTLVSQPPRGFLFIPAPPCSHNTTHYTPTPQHTTHSYLSSPLLSQSQLLLVISFPTACSRLQTSTPLQHNAAGTRMHLTYAHQAPRSSSMPNCHAAKPPLPRWRRTLSNTQQQHNSQPGG